MPGTSLLAPLARSYSLGSRARRMVRFRTLVADLPAPVRIVDIGGSPEFWLSFGPATGRLADFDVTIVNRYAQVSDSPRLRTVIGDARDLSEFEDQTFDVAFSNSVLEHVGGTRDQFAMAREVQRVGRRYFVQVPNRSFPIEPHVLLPGFQYLPLRVQVWAVTHLYLGWHPRIERAAAERVWGTTRMVTERELRAMFPDGTLEEERLLGLVKSFIVVGQSAYH
jgi:hypothetical protein